MQDDEFVMFTGYNGFHLVRKSEIACITSPGIDSDNELIHAMVEMNNGQRKSITMGVTVQEIEERFFCGENILGYFAMLLELCESYTDATSE